MRWGKCLGPDGYNFIFIKIFWGLLKVDILKFIIEFHEKAKIPKAISVSLFALVPKFNNLQDLGDYRPFCIVSTLYKIPVKVLVMRLKRVLGKVISPHQTTFIPNRHILDEFLMVDEIIDLDRRK